MSPTHNAKRAAGISRATITRLVVISPKTIGIVFLPTAISPFTSRRSWICVRSPAHTDTASMLRSFFGIPGAIAFHEAPRRDHTPRAIATQLLPNQWFPAGVKQRNTTTDTQHNVSGNNEGSNAGIERNASRAMTHRHLALLSVTFPEGMGLSGLLIQSSSTPII